MLVALHRVRPAASVRLHPADTDQRRRGHPHSESSATQQCGQPPHLLHLFHAHLQQFEVNQQLLLLLFHTSEIRNI